MTEKPPEYVKVLCRACWNCTLDPLPPEMTGKNHPRLHTCKAGKFTSIEEHRLPRFNPPDDICEAFDGDLIREPRKKKNRRYINLSEILSPSLLKKLQLQAPQACGKEAYIPKPNLSAKQHARVLKTFRRLRSIRGTAKTMGLKRDTIRLHLDREIQKLIDSEVIITMEETFKEGGSTKSSSSTTGDYRRHRILRVIEKLRAGADDKAIRELPKAMKIKMPAPSSSSTSPTSEEPNGEEDQAGKKNPEKKGQKKKTGQKRKKTTTKAKTKGKSKPSPKKTPTRKKKGAQK